MKFKKENNSAVIITILFMTGFLIIDLLLIIKTTNESNQIINIMIPLIICPIILVIITDYIKNKKYDKLYDKFKDGNKITGYVVSTFEYKYRYGRNNYKISYGIKVLAENKIYIVDRLENNETYKKLETKLNEVQMNYDIMSFNKMPVDVFLKNDDYYVDIESIKI
jgi:hypothetical protein